MILKQQAMLTVRTVPDRLNAKIFFLLLHIFRHFLFINFECMQVSYEILERTIDKFDCLLIKIE